MIALLALGFPGVLLGLMLAMERVEAPLRDEAVGDQLVDFLDSARPDEVETFVSEGFAPRFALTAAPSTTCKPGSAQTRCQPSSTPSAARALIGAPPRM